MPEPPTYAEWLTGVPALLSETAASWGLTLGEAYPPGACSHVVRAELPDGLPGPRPMFFFAPDRVNKRSADWGRDDLEQRLAEAWRPYLKWTDSWLEVLHAQGPQALEGAYLDLLDGRIDPAKAHVLSLQG